MRLTPCALTLHASNLARGAAHVCPQPLHGDEGTIGGQDAVEGRQDNATLLHGGHEQLAGRRARDHRRALHSAPQGALCNATSQGLCA